MLIRTILDPLEPNGLLLSDQLRVYRYLQVGVPPMRRLFPADEPNSIPGASWRQSFVSSYRNAPNLRAWERHLWSCR